MVHTVGMSQREQRASTASELSHAGASKTEWVVGFLPLLRLLFKAALVSLVIWLVTLKYGKPYLRIEYQYIGSRDNIISANYWSPFGKLHVHGDCPLVLWVKDPVCPPAHPATHP